MTRKRLISRADLAHRAGVSRSAITKICKGKLAVACVDDRIDAAHEAVVDYLASKVIKAPKGSKATKKKGPGKKKAPARKSKKAKKAKKKAAPKPDPSEGTGYEEFDSVEPYASMTLREIIAEFGSRRAFKDWLEALKKIEDIRKTRIDNDETEGRLIDRDLVRTHIIGYIDSAQRRLLTDTPKTIASRLYALAKAGEPIEVAVEDAKKLIQDQLRPLKAAASRNLRKKLAP